MTDVDWIKDLIRVEREMDEEGVVDISPVINPEQSLHDSTIQYLKDIREKLVDLTTAFNQLRGNAIGGIKIYAISRTEADFMLFRNSYKLIFSAKAPGQIAIRFQSHIPTLAAAGASPDPNFGTVAYDEDIIHARWGAFGEINWTYDNLPVNVDYLVRYYLSRFIKESAK